MRRFVMYRRNIAAFGRHDENQMNPPEQVQFEGVLFSDGKVAVRWLTAKRSVAVWDSMDDMLSIHGHPEYGSELVWLDKEVSDADAEGEGWISLRIEGKGLREEGGR